MAKPIRRQATAAQAVVPRRLGRGLACGALLMGLVSCVPFPAGSAPVPPSGEPLPATGGAPAVSASPLPVEVATVEVPGMDATSGEQVEVAVQGDTAVIDVYSPGGIGDAYVRLASAGALRQVRLRFHLRGLEHWEFVYDGVTVAGSLPSQPGAEASETLRRQAQASDTHPLTPQAPTVQAGVGQTPSAQPGTEQEITPGSPYWMAVKVVVPAGSEPSIPLKAGYFELEAPQDFLRSGTSRFTIGWIDFYR